MKTKLLLLTSVLAMVGCSGQRSQPNIELIQDMMVSPAVKSQDFDPNSNKLPPANTIPVGFTPYPYQTPDEAGLKLMNPTKPNPETLKHGETLFNTYCSVCHGQKMDGKGPVAAKYPMPIPNLLTTRARGYKDGYLYHMIARGRGLMGSYGTQILPDDRWLVVNYLRQVQANSPVLADDGTPVK